MSAFFLNTDTIPAGSTITGWLTLLDDGSFIDFDQFTLSQDLAAGSFIQLPLVGSFGDLWQQVSLDFTFFYTDPSGNNFQADGFAQLGEPYAFSDLPFIEPVLAQATQSIAKNKDMILKVTGYFTTDAPLVVLSDFYFIYVVPTAAINVVSTSEIDIDLSMVQGLDLTSVDEMLLTISQAGFGDTLDFRYVPADPATFNLAPMARRQ